MHIIHILKNNLMINSESEKRTFGIRINNSDNGPTLHYALLLEVNALNHYIGVRLNH